MISFPSSKSWSRVLFIALRAICANCSQSIPTEAGHPHPLDETLRRETWGLVGLLAGRKTVFATCDPCHEAGWRPPDADTWRIEPQRGNALTYTSKAPDSSEA